MRQASSMATTMSRLMLFRVGVCQTGCNARSTRLPAASHRRRRGGRCRSVHLDPLSPEIGLTSSTLSMKSWRAAIRAIPKAHRSPPGCPTQPLLEVPGDSLVLSRQRGARWGRPVEAFLQRPTDLLQPLGRQGSDRVEDSGAERLRRHPGAPVHGNGDRARDTLRVRLDAHGSRTRRGPATVLVRSHARAVEAGPESVQVCPASRRGRQHRHGLHCSNDTGPGQWEDSPHKPAARHTDWVCRAAGLRQASGVRGHPRRRSAHRGHHDHGHPTATVARTALATFAVLATLGTVVVRSRVVAGVISRLADRGLGTLRRDGGQRRLCRAGRSPWFDLDLLTDGQDVLDGVDRLPPTSLRTSEMYGRPSLPGRGKAPKGRRLYDGPRRSPISGICGLAIALISPAPRRTVGRSWIWLIICPSGR